MIHPEEDPKLAAQMDRCLKDLPEVAAPPTLIARTLRACASSSALGRNHSWSTWPQAWRVAYLAAAVAGLAAVFFGWRATVPVLAATAHTWLSQGLAAASCLWETLSTLASATVLLARHASGWLAWGLLAVLLLVCAAYAGCVGCGTLLFRFAFSSSGQTAYEE